MMFKQFDIDYDRITIDGIEVKKPSYMSPTQWLEFWEVFDGQLVEQKVSIAFDKGYDCRSGEQDKEIEQVKEFCFNQFETLEKDIDSIIEDEELDAYEKLTEFKNYINVTRDEIWQL